MKTRRGWIFVSLVLTFAVALVATAHARRTARQRERSDLEHRAQDLAAVRAENLRLRTAIVATVVPTATEVAEARAALGQVQSQVAAAARAIAGANADSFAIGTFALAADWRNVGNATPESTLETALWAGAGGDVDALSGLLHISPTARSVIEKALAELPPGLRAKYATPEQFVAELTVPDAPVTAIRVAAWNIANVEQTRQCVHFEEYSDTSPDPKIVRLMLEQGSSGWHIVVPDEVVAHYVNRLKTGS